MSNVGNANNAIPDGETILCDGARLDFSQHLAADRTGCSTGISFFGDQDIAVVIHITQNESAPGHDSCSSQ